MNKRLVSFRFIEETIQRLGATYQKMGRYCARHSVNILLDRCKIKVMREIIIGDRDWKHLYWL